MTKRILVFLGVSIILMSLFAQFQTNTLWSLLLSTDPFTTLLKELLAFAMIIYALVPEARTRHTAKFLAGFSVVLFAVTVVSVFRNRMPLIDGYLYALSSIFCLLASLELPIQTKPILTTQLNKIKVPEPTSIRHAH